MGTSAIIRMSFVLACFHIMVFLVVLARNTAASVFHDGCWMLKFLIVLAYFIATMWIPNIFFNGYLIFSRWVSIAFLVYQALLMLVVSYKINEALVSNYERDGSGFSGALIIIVTAIITVINIVWAVFQYIWYSGCGYNSAIITVTVVAGIVFYVLVILRTREDASILTSSIVFLYCLYL